MGSLEASVLERVWAHPDGATSREVLEELGGDIAYTTVMTILNRLWRKDLLIREPRGRAYAYRSTVSEADLAARRMNDAFNQVKDRPAALSRFVGSLSAKDEKVLRDLLGSDTVS